MKIVELKKAGEELTGDKEDAVVKAAVGDATHCDKCRQEKSPLIGRMVWIDGRGMHLVRICQECHDEIKVATDKMMAELRAKKAAGASRNTNPCGEDVEGTNGGVHLMLEKGRLLVHRESRDVASVYKVLPNGNVILEGDCDGSLQNDDNPEGDGPPAEVLKRWEVWQPGMVVRDRTGKGVFCREATNWKSFIGVPAPEVEQRVAATQPSWAPPVASLRGTSRITPKDTP